jgi:predicted transcriptional regulator
MMKKYTVKPWTQEDLNLLRTEYEKKTKKELARLLNRSVSAVRNKAYELKITNNINWTKEEINYLKTNYAVQKPKDIAKKLNRTISSIQNKAEKMGLRNSYNTWSEEEVSILLKNYCRVSPEEWNRLLPFKSYKSIC